MIPVKHIKYEKRLELERRAANGLGSADIFDDLKELDEKREYKLKKMESLQRSYNDIKPKAEGKADWNECFIEILTRLKRIENALGTSSDPIDTELPSIIKQT